MGNELSVLGQVKSYLSQETVKNKFNEVLGSKANQFMTSITNAIGSNNSLQKCEANSIMSSALVAATYDLPIDSNLGFSALVPYWDGKNKVYKAQFQMMYKGFVQLAIRSGAYENMNVSEVYEDELIDFNPITGELKLTKSFSDCAQRKEGKKDKIIGYYAWFKLLTGFRKELFMSVEDVNNHAITYSQSYKKDLKEGWTASKWTTDFESMAKKTVLKLLLSRWGVLSIDMQRAIQDDQKVFNDDGQAEYTDNKEDKEEVIDPFATESEESENDIN
jgi:recombination protein RecT